MDERHSNYLDEKGIVKENEGSGESSVVVRCCRIALG